MGIRPVEVDVMCDGDDCYAVLWLMLCPLMGSAGYKELDPQIESRGWTVRGGETFCQDCSTALTRGKK